MKAGVYLHKKIPIMWGFSQTDQVNPRLLEKVVHFSIKNDEFNFLAFFKERGEYSWKKN
jgi:hypothetical protein